MKKYFIAGILAWAPIFLTIWLISVIFGSVNSVLKNILLWLHEVLRIPIPDIAFRIADIPGVGLLSLILIIFITGILATNVIFKWLIGEASKFITRIPIIKSIYSTSKQIFDTVLSDNSKSFKQAVLIQFPATDNWTIAFVTGIINKQGAIITQIPQQNENIDNQQEDWLSVYVPTTPNPTSGYLLIINSKNVKPLDIKVEDALKYIVSMGVINLSSTEKTKKVTKVSE